MPFYAVVNGRVPGVYNSWASTEKHVVGYSGVEYPKFPRYSSARDHFMSRCGRKAHNASLNAHGVCNCCGVLTVYTDGACQRGDYGPYASYGVFVCDDHLENKSVHMESEIRPTNQRAELAGMASGLNLIYEFINDGHAFKGVLVTDSMYAINCVTVWCHKWLKNGWVNSRGVRVANFDLIDNALSAYESVEEIGPVEIKHVKSHSGVYGNEQADRLASMALTPDYVYGY